MNANSLRRAFTDFFVERGHTAVPSSGVIPHHPTAPLFTNAGMVKTFDQVATAEGLSAGALGHDAYQTLTIASLVESEGKVAADRPKIARVIDNRLNIGMKALCQ